MADIVTECIVCTEIYVNPKLFPCRHNLCEGCFKQLVRGSKVQCPTCREYSDVELVVHDTRLEEFIEALKEKDKALKQKEEEIVQLLSDAATSGPSVQPSAPPLDDVKASRKCELCEDDSVAFFCTDCQQWLCSRCKKTHLKAKISKDHRVEKLSDKNKEVSTSILNQIQSLKKKIDAFQRCVAKFESEIRYTQDIQVRTLAQSGILREECINEVKKCFDRIDQSILSKTEKQSSELGREKGKLEKRVRDLQSECQKYESIVKKKDPHLSIDGASLVKKVNELVEKTEDPDLRIVSISLQLRRLQEWSAEAARLDVNGGTIFRQSAVSGGCESLACVNTRRWQRQHSADVPGYAYCLRLINGQLHQCHESGITIYSTALEWLRTIESGDMGQVFDVAGVQGGQLVAAASNGLYHLYASGEQLQRIASGNFTGVVHHASRYYAVNRDTKMVYVYEFTNQWKQCNSFQIESNSISNWITLCISDGSLYVCPNGDNKVYIYSLSGQRQGSTGSKRSGEVGLVNRPFIAASDSDGAVLIADLLNNRLQVLSARRQWSLVQLEPGVEEPLGALVVGGKLYVNEYANKKLHMYTRD